MTRLPVFKEMSRVPLLSVDEEMSIAKRIELGRQCKSDLPARRILQSALPGALYGSG